MIIQKSIRVERPPEISFRLFCDEIGRWWPRGPSFGGKELADMFIEGHIGGRFYERYVDGTEYEIGRVTAYEPPHVVGFTWRAPSWALTTQVEIRFSAEGPGTRVELEHHGFEQADNIRATAKSYDSGWGEVLAKYITHANASG
jgi:uncharacterized protein YndB with AHSA1/START domain